MAIAYGSITTRTQASTANSVSIPSADCLGIVYHVGDLFADNLTGVTWDGDAMTKVASFADSYDRAITVWYIANPSTGVSTLASTGGTFNEWVSSYYTGTDLTDPIDDAQTNGRGTQATAISVSITSTVADSWFVVFVKDDSGNKTYTASNDVSEERLATSAGGQGIADSGSTVSTGSLTGTMTANSSVRQQIIGFNIIPPAPTTSIAKVDGIAQASIAKVDGIALASIEKIDGISNTS